MPLTADNIIVMILENSPPKQNVQTRTLAQILREGGDGRIVGAGTARERKGKAAIMLLDHLSLRERETLDGMTHLVIDLEEDLLEQITRLHNENIHLRSLTLIDDLTGLYNSRYFFMQLDIEMARTRRTGLQCCLLMVDLDNFKLLNDTFGHLEGNRFLAAFGKTLREHVRPTDIVCRYGGDEFAIIMPATGMFDAMRTAKRLREGAWEMAKPAGLNISTSIGVAEYTASSSCGPDKFIRLADSAMYNAKRNGKNQVCSAGQTEGAHARSGQVDREEKEALFAIYESTTRGGDQNGD
jgi:two-component system, cell cycle response regulator